MAKKNVEIKDCNKGNWWVEVTDSCYNCTTTYRTISGVTKAIAKSIERHFNRQLRRLEMDCGEQIPIGYFADCHENHDMGDIYGSKSILIHSKEDFNIGKKISLIPEDTDSGRWHWVILKWDNDNRTWHSVGCGLEESYEVASEMAKKAFDSIN